MSEVEKTTLNRDQIEAILWEEEVGVLSMCRGDEPYAVPISHAYMDGNVYFHCALKGRKIDFLEANPRVCYSVSRNQDPMRPHHAGEGCEYRFESVLCFGRARFVEDPDERLQGLRAFKAHFDRRLGSDPEKNPVDQKAAMGTKLVVIEIDEMTGRRRG